MLPWRVQYSVFRSLISSRLSQHNGKQWKPPKSKEEGHSTHTPQSSCQIHQGSCAACGDPAAAGLTPAAFQGLSRCRPYTSQGVFELYDVCMLPVFTVELGAVLCACMLVCMPCSVCCGLCLWISALESLLRLCCEGRLTPCSLPSWSCLKFSGTFPL